MLAPAHAGPHAPAREERDPNRLKNGFMFIAVDSLLGTDPERAGMPHFGCNFHARKPPSACDIQTLMSSGVQGCINRSTPGLRIPHDLSPVDALGPMPTPTGPTTPLSTRR
jgi:hypothetical protein